MDGPKRMDSQDLPYPSREYEDDDDENTNLLSKAPPTGVDVGRGSGGVDLQHHHQPGDGQWGFWDLVKYRPVRVMCSTMFLNSYVAQRLSDPDVVIEKCQR
jgi:hypothetical protein